MLHYAFAVLAVAAAVGAALIVQGSLQNAPHVSLLMCAVLFAAWQGGAGPGLLAIGVSILAFDYFFVSPGHPFTVGVLELLRLMLFAVAALFVVSLSVAQRRTVQSLRSARDDLAEREAKIRRLVDANIIGIFIANCEGDILEANDAFLRTVGYNQEDLVSGRVRWTDLTPPEWRERTARALAEVARTGTIQPYEKEYVRKDGSRVPVLVGAASFDGSERVAFVIDLTERKRAEEALRESEEQWKAVFENNPTMYLIVDAAGTVLSVNPFGAEQLGYSVDELVGRSVLDVFHEADRETARGNVATCVKQFGRSMQWEACKTRKDGSLVWVRETARAMSIKQRPVVLVACEDITERKRAEEELWRSEAYLAEAQRLSHTGTFGWTVSSGELYWPDQTYRIFEYDRTEKPTVELVLQRTHPEDLALTRQTIEGAQQESSFDLEHRLLMLDGRVKYLHVVAKASERDQAGNREFVGAVMDITERKAAEQRLRAAEQELRRTIDTIPALVASGTPDGTAAFFNARWIEEGFSEQDLLSDWSTLVHPEDLPGLTEKRQRSLAGGEPYEVEARLRRIDGEYRWFLIRHLSLRDASGQVVKRYQTATDIEDLKRAGAELRASERRYRYIFQATGVSIWEEDFSRVKAAIDELKAAGVRDLRQYLAEHPEFVRQAISWVRIVDVNDATVGLFGAASKDQLLASLEKVFVPETQEVFAGELIALAEGRTSFEAETVLRTLAGERLTVLFTVRFPAQPDRFDSVLATVIDITQRKRAEVLTEQVMESSPDGVAVVGRDYRYRRVNPIYERLWQIPVDRIVGMPVADLLGTEAFEQTIKPRLDRCFAGEEESYTHWLGSAFGRRYLAVSYSPLRLDSKAVEAALVIVRDLTEHDLAAEALREAQMKLAHVNRVTTMGQLTASIAHEVNQPVAAAVTNAQAGLRWLAAHPPDLYEARGALDRIVRDGNRASEVIGRIRNLVRGGPPRRDQVDVNDTILEVVALTRPEAERHRVVLQTRTRARPAARLWRSYPTAAGDPQSDHERHRSDERMRRGARGAGRLGTRRCRRGAPHSAGFRPGAGPGGSRPPVRGVPHDQARRYRHGAGDQPFDRRGARRPAVGDAERAQRRGLSVHAAVRGRRGVLVAAYTIGLVTMRLTR